MALTKHTRTKVGVQEWTPTGNGAKHEIGLDYPAVFTDYSVQRRWVGNAKEPSYPGSSTLFTYYYGYVDWSASISKGGFTLSTSGQMKSGRYTGSSNAQYWANTNNPSNVSVVIGKSYPMTGSPYGSGVPYTYEEVYYTGKVTVRKVLDNGTAKLVSETEYDAGTNVTVPIPEAFPNSVLSGVTIDGGSQATYKANGYTVNVNDNHVIVFRFTATVEITLAVGTGGKSIAGESTTSFTNVKTSKTVTSGNGSLIVQKGQGISLTAIAATNYVLHTDAVVSSASGYGAMNGTGGATASFSKVCIGATTFTVRGKQYFVTPSIVDGGVGKKSWGTAKIRKSGSSSWNTTALLLTPNTTYELGFDSSTASTLAAAVDYWEVGGTRCASSTFTTGATITGAVSALLYLEQTKWQLTVKNGTNASWGTVSGGGWYASGVKATVKFTPTVANIKPEAYQVNYNGSTTSCGNTAIITTTNASLTATLYLRQTKFLMTVAYGNAGTDDWGAIGGGGVYVGTGDTVTLNFAPKASLVSTIHPQVDHWTLLQQTARPTQNADGSSSVNVTLGTVTSDFTAYCYLMSTWRKVTILRADSGAKAWGNFYLGTSGTSTTAYYAPGSQITMRFAHDSSYSLKERPQVDLISIGTEHAIFGENGKFVYTYALPANVKTDLVISCTAKQTAWPVSVFISMDSVESMTAKRIDISTNTVVDSVTNAGQEKTIYLRHGTSAEYLALTVKPKNHYAFSSWSKTNLATYNGNAAMVQLASAAAATVKAVCSRNDFLITGTSDMSTVCDVYMQDTSQSRAYYLKTVKTNPVVVCKIKSAYADQYRVSSFSIGSQSNIEPQYNAAADIYYVEVSGRSDVTVTAHIVPTSFDFTVNVSPGNHGDFGKVVISANGQELAEGGYAGRLREGTQVSIVFYEKYGGRIIGMQASSQIAQSVQTDRSVEFVMPSADCSVDLKLGAKEVYSLTVGVVNLANDEASIIPGVVRVVSRTYPNIVIGATGEDGIVKTFTVYKGEEYSLVVGDVSDYLSRRYAFVGWRNASDAIVGALSKTLNILNTEDSTVVRYASYNSRQNGTITIEYAKKDGETIASISADAAKYILQIDNTADKYDETHWLVGPDIDIGYTARGTAYDEDGDAYKWTPVQVDVALVGDAYDTPNATWDDGVLTQNGTFKMLGNMKVRLVLTQTHVPGYTTVRVGYRQSNAQMGDVSIFATEMDAYTKDASGATVLAQKEKKAVIMAAPRPGFAFAGWFVMNGDEWKAVSGAKAVYEIAFVTSPMDVYYAQFVASTLSNVRMWNGNGGVAKTFEWQSKVYVGAQFFSLSACRVYADAYPVTLKIMMSSSPDGVFGERARSVEITIKNQDPRRIPSLRMEKYLAFKVSGYARINHVGLASSMEALK